MRVGLWFNIRTPEKAERGTVQDELQKIRDFFWAARCTSPFFATGGLHFTSPSSRSSRNKRSSKVRPGRSAAALLVHRRKDRHRGCTLTLRFQHEVQAIASAPVTMRNCSKPHPSRVSRRPKGECEPWASEQEMLDSKPGDGKV